MPWSKLEHDGVFSYLCPDLLNRSPDLLNRSPDLLNRSHALYCSHFTKPISRFTKSASRFTEPVSRFSKSVSRLAHTLLNRSPKSASRFTLLNREADLLYRCPCPCAACLWECRLCQNTMCKNCMHMFNTLNCIGLPIY